MKQVYKRKIICIILLITFLLNLMPISRAEENVNLPQSGTSGTCSWEIDEDGNLTVRPTNGTEGTLASMPGSDAGVPWYEYREKIKTVNFEGKVYTGTSARALFNGLKNCTSMNLQNLDTSKTTNMLKMFYDCSSLIELDLTNFNTSEATRMDSMFSGCSNLTSLKVGELDASKVTTMASMFSKCSSLTSLDLSGIINTTSLTTMKQMLHHCSSLKELDISNFDTTNVENLIQAFGNAEVPLNKIKLGPKTMLYSNNEKGATFGRGTWERQEDGEHVSAVEVSAMTEGMEGTYLKKSNISTEMKVDVPVTYKIGGLNQIDDFSTDRPDIYRTINGKYVVADVNLHDPGEGIDYVLPGKVELLFKDVVEDRDGKKYDFGLTIENITYHDLHEVGEIGSVISEILNVKNGAYTSTILFFENDQNVIAGIRKSGSFENISVRYDTTINILNKDGSNAEGNFIFSAYDLDGASRRDFLNNPNGESYEGSINQTTGEDTRKAYGNYSEGINLKDGFDYDTIKKSEHGILEIVDIGSYKRVYGKGLDNETERTEFIVKANSVGSKYTWTSRYSMGTDFAKYYQPQIVEIIKKDDAGNLVDGAKMTIYDNNREKIEEWTTSKTESQRLFLMPGKYTLKEEETPDGYKTAETIEFFVDINNSIIRDGEKVDNIVMIDNRKEAKVIVHHYIEGTTTSVPLAKGGEAEDTLINKMYFEEYETMPVEPSEEYELVKELTTITPEGRKESGIVDVDEIVVTYYYRLKKNTEIEEQEEEKITDDNNPVIEEEQEEKIIDGNNIITSANDKEKPSIPLTGVFQNYNSFVVLAVIGGLGLLAVSKKRLLFVKKHKYVGKRFK